GSGSGNGNGNGSSWSGNRRLDKMPGGESRCRERDGERERGDRAPPPRREQYGSALARPPPRREMVAHQARQLGGAEAEARRRLVERGRERGGVRVALRR